MMKYKIFNVLFLIVFLPSTFFSQTTEIQGRVNIAFMDTIETGSTVVVRQAEGTLAERAASRLSASASGDTLYLSNDNWVIIPGVSPIMDADGNAYMAVRIGTQEWLTENLKTTRYNDGTPITLVTDSIVWSTLSSPAYCWLNNDSAMYADKFGALYNYFVVADSSSKKVCPSGWQIPTHNDWEILKDYVRNHGHFFIEGEALKAVTDWILVPPYGGTDDYRFKGLPAAFRNVSGTFGDVGYETWFRSNTEYNDSTATAWQLYYESSDFSKFWTDKKLGFSVRCLRN